MVLNFSLTLGNGLIDSKIDICLAVGIKEGQGLTAWIAHSHFGAHKL